MINGQKVVVVMPAYNAGKTLKQTYREIPLKLVDEVILTDDNSLDDTLSQARELGIRHIITHDENKGYGANQKSCYTKALDLGADIIIMLHPDYQYTPKLIEPMAYIIANGVYPVVIGSRIIGNGALRGGMPLYKYVANRFLTLVQNLLMGQKLSEYHTGYRAFAAPVLNNIHFDTFSDDFVFDNQMLAKICFLGYDIGEISCPTKYFDAASSINFKRSLVYGLGVLKVSWQYALAKRGLGGKTLFNTPQKS